MAQISGSPLYMKDVVLSLGSNSYEKVVNSVAFTPSGGIATFKGLTPDAVYSFPQSPTWTCDITYAQDWDTTGSLSRYLFDNEGSTVAATFRPRTGAGPSFTANLFITSGAIGGAVDSVATATVSLGVQGKPTLVPAA